MVVAHNLLAMNANRQFGITTNNSKKSTEKLSSGYRINRASDDAAGLSISEKLRYQIRGLDRGQKNTMDGVSWCQIGDGALQEIEDMVQRIRELSVQASNDTNTQQDRNAIDSEVKELRKEINQTAYHAMFNTQHIFYSKESSFGVIGAPTDLQVYTANTAIGSEQFPLSASNSIDVNTDFYGGVIFDGKRIPWEEIKKNMIDSPAAGTDSFHPGAYGWTGQTDLGNNRHFTFTTDPEHPEIPNYTRHMDLTASAGAGVIIDGETLPWTKVVDENGLTMQDAANSGYIHDGVWMFEYHDAMVGFYLQNMEDLDDVARAIKEPHENFSSYAWDVPYAGYSTERAVTADATNQIVVTQSMKHTLLDNEAQHYDETFYTVQANKNGVWLKDASNTDVPGSLQTWEEMFGLPAGTKVWEDWVRGEKLSDHQGGYLYYDFDNPDAVNRDTHISFSYSLSDITGMDDVIEGLHGMTIGGNTQTSYKTGNGSTIDTVNVSHSYTKISYEDEKTLGRNFDNPAYRVATGLYLFDENQQKDKVTLELTNDADSTKKLLLKGDFFKDSLATDQLNSINDIETELMKGVEGYIEDIIDYKTAELLGQPTPPEPKHYHTSITGTFVSYDTDGVYNHKDKIDSQISSMISYDHKDLFNQINVGWIQDPTNGNYVMDGGSFRPYNSKTDGAMDRYSINVTYGDGLSYAERLEQHTKKVMRDTLGFVKDGSGNYVQNPTLAHAKTALGTTAFTTVKTNGRENPNSANRSLFRSEVVKTPLRSGIHIQNSSNVGDDIIIPQFAMNTVELGIFAINTKTYDDAQMAIEACDNAVSIINKCRSIFGSSQNRLEHTINNSANAEENQQAAESRIRDTDMAKEMVNYSKHNILAQVGQAMMSQANQSTQGTLALLQ